MVSYLHISEACHSPHSHGGGVRSPREVLCEAWRPKGPVINYRDGAYQMLHVHTKIRVGRGGGVFNLRIDKGYKRKMLVYELYYDIDDIEMH